MRRKLVVFFTAYAAVVALLAWVLLPYLLPPKYHAVDITIEHRNYLYFPVYTDTSNVRALVPQRIKLQQPEFYAVWFYLGLLHVEIGGESYDCVFLWVSVRISALPVGPVATTGEYVLDFFSNSSQLGDIFQSYGFPHTYVRATYHYVYEGDVNRTALTMTYPNGSLLVNASAVTSNAFKPHAQTPKNLYAADYHLRNSHNLSVLRYKEEAVYVAGSPEGIGHLNMTIGEGSVARRALGDIEYVTKVILSATCPLYRIVGKIGWVFWR